MVRSNYMMLVFSLLGCSLGAMDKNEKSRPLTQCQELMIWHQGNLQELKVEYRRDLKSVALESRLIMKMEYNESCRKFNVKAHG